MRRLTGIFGGTNVGPLGGGFDNGGWETNTVSDTAAGHLWMTTTSTTEEGARSRAARPSTSPRTTSI